MRPPPELLRSLKPSFIEWARYTLSHGDPVEEVSKVYGRLVQHAAKERVERQSRFGSLLKVWNNDAGYLKDGLLPIENGSTGLKHLWPKRFPCCYWCLMA